MFNTIPGESLAFVIAPDLTIRANSEGQYLGLTNSSTDGNATNHLIVVELDTVKQDFDPDNHHSIQSKVNESLSNFDITIAQNKRVLHTVDDQYDGETKELNVYINTHPVLKSNINIRDYVNKWSYFGFAASTGMYSQLNAVLNWKLELKNYSGHHDSKAWIKITVGVGAPVLVLVLCVIVVYFLRKRRNQDDSIILGVLKRLPGTPKEFRFHDLNIATSNFDEKLKLGQGW
ncbi:L-type lectin-domain containing receptor kinase V.9 [Thalictrum thalictroides]|uniref:L-type lectin-domain containing receptor kinase V.9 n=1 Tax=Thalictrum thalictroides TaxID=46969 RepID=A0A7J6VEF8_THATH|nr:L-type lectin-domain containing receptor kinase V.9 [Thalictrum thalictroides]